MNIINIIVLIGACLNVLTTLTHISLKIKLKIKLKSSIKAREKAQKELEQKLFNE